MLYIIIQSIQKAGVAHHQFQPLRVLAQPVIDFIESHKELLGTALDYLPCAPKIAVALPFLKGSQPHPGIHEALCDFPQPGVIPVALVPHLDVSSFKISPARRPDPANQIKGQIRAGRKLRLLHLQQKPLRSPLRQLILRAIAMDALGVHGQGIKLQAPFLILQIFYELLAQIAHLPQIVHQLEHFFPIVHSQQLLLYKKYGQQYHASTAARLQSSLIRISSIYSDNTNSICTLPESSSSPGSTGVTAAASSLDLAASIDTS